MVVSKILELNVNSSKNALNWSKDTNSKDKNFQINAVF